MTAQRKRDIYLRVIAAAAGTVGISALIGVYGLSDRVYFNKTILSVLTFAAYFAAAGRAAAEFRTDRSRASWSFALAWLLSFTEELGMGMRLAANGIPAVINAGTTAFMALCAVPAALLLEPAFFRLAGCIKDREEKSADGKDGKNAGRVFLLAWFVVFLAYIPCFLAFFPGLYCYDMIWQWGMFASHNYNTHHPLIHTLISSGLIEFGKNIFGSYNAGLAVHSLFQLLVLSGSIAFAGSFLGRLRIGRRLWLAVMLFYILFPFFPVLGVSTTKDVLFGCLFLDVFTCLCDMVSSRRVYRGWRLAGFLAVSALMGMFRNNAVYGLAFSVFAMLLVWLFAGRRSREGKFLLQLTALLFAAVILTEGGFSALEVGLHAGKGSVAEMMSIPCQQLARIYVNHSDEIGAEEREELFRYIPEDALKQYRYWLSDPVKDHFNADYFNGNRTGFLRLWLRMGKRFPGDFILAPLYNTLGAWYLGGDSSCYMEYEMSRPFDEAHRVESRSLLPPLKKVYSWFNDVNFQKYLPVVSLIFYTSFYAWMVLAAAVLIAVRRRWIYLVLPLFCAGYILTLLLGPCMTVRYMFGVILCVPVLLAVVMRGMETYTAAENM